MEQHFRPTTEQVQPGTARTVTYHVLGRTTDVPRRTNENSPQFGETVTRPTSAHTRRGGSRRRGASRGRRPDARRGRPRRTRRAAADSAARATKKVSGANPQQKDRVTFIKKVATRRKRQLLIANQMLTRLLPKYFAFCRENVRLCSKPADSLPTALDWVALWAARRPHRHKRPSCRCLCAVPRGRHGSVFQSRLREVASRQHVFWKAARLDLPAGWALLVLMVPFFHAVCGNAGTESASVRVGVALFLPDFV